MVPLFKVFMPKKLPEIRKILLSGSLSYGIWGKNFEKLVSDYLGNELFLSVNSYTSAILVTILTLNLRPDDEILASPMCCLASIQPYKSYGIKIKWVDIDPNTGTIDPENIKENITRKTKAIVHNHHCGYLGYIEEIQKIAQENGLFYIDDAIEAFGSEYKNKKMGNLNSDVTLFSFQTVRLPNTIDGGGISFKNKSLFEKAKLIRDLGIKREIFRDNLGEINKKCDVIISGLGATLNEFSSYIGYEQMKFIESFLLKQRVNAKYWDLILRGHKEFYPLKPLVHSLPNFWVYGCRSKNKLKAIEFFRNKGFQASGVHVAVNSYSVFKSTRDLKGVKEFEKTFFAIPSGWWVKQKQQRKVQL